MSLFTKVVKRSLKQTKNKTDAPWFYSNEGREETKLSDDERDYRSGCPWELLEGNLRKISVVVGIGLGLGDHCLGVYIFHNSSNHTLTIYAFHQM